MFLATWEQQKNILLLSVIKLEVLAVINMVESFFWFVCF